MKRKKWLCVLLTLLLLLSGCGGTSQQETEDPGKEATESDIQEESVGITAIVYNNDTALTRFISDQNGHWYWTDDTDFPLDQTYIEQLLKLLAGMRDVVVQPVATEDPIEGEGGGEITPDYGLSDSHKTLTITDGKKQDTVYQVGNCAGGVLYLGVLNENKSGGTVCCVDSGLMDILSRSIFSLAVLPTMPELTMENAQSVTLKGTGSETVLRSGDRGWICSGKDMTGQVAELLAALSSLQVDSCVDFSPSPGAVEMCGLAQPRATVKVTYTNSVGKTAEISVCVGAVRDSGGVFITLNDEKTVYQVSERAILPLLDMVNSNT